MKNLIKEFGIEKLQAILKKVVVENIYNGERHVVNRTYVGVDGMTIYVEDESEGEDC